MSPTSVNSSGHSGLWTTGPQRSRDRMLTGQGGPTRGWLL
ncbi:MAG: hypothetical protein AVDCRST_MAG36-2131 [uncultured Nocardioidaceae bacterium]|uniref:Uncharacterized protein n=1 Tax=uncultured Nocardioidaceae bacterium TaxID=253824 RepID=A0A6J4MEW9_9ACTN|nr:MAG: hypothetical protein AVDCRST_MAG36-2131 [uncultured Nocardioidaceae bacterium]